MFVRWLHAIHSSVSTATAGLPHRLFRYGKPSPIAAARTGTLDAGAAVIEVVFARVDVLEDALGDAHECLLDILARLSRGLDVLQNAVAAGPFFGLLLGHLALVLGRLGLVEFVADEDDDDVWVGDRAQVIQPVSNVVEGRFASYVENEQGAGCATEIGACY